MNLPVTATPSSENEERNVFTAVLLSSRLVYFTFNFFMFLLFPFHLFAHPVQTQRTVNSACTLPCLFRFSLNTALDT